MMNNTDPKLIILQFNESINNQDIEGLSKLMANHYKFIDSGDEAHDGKERNVQGWIEFFNQFPDYINHFSMIESRENTVLVTGYSTCSDDRLDGPAIWVAKVKDDLIEE
jgi:hypothetical protein